MQFNIISLLPEMFTALSAHGVSGRAYQKSLYQLHFFNPRSYTEDVHHTVDDRPYGGGPGMVMMYPPIKDALTEIRNTHGETKVIYMSPQGTPLTHKKVMALSQLPSITLLCGRYEGVDQRVIDHLVDEEISIGDYVLSGGEIPAMALMDAMIRQIPGALGHAQSAVQDSFVDTILDAPHYTRPESIDGFSVPKILLSGNHQKIAEWRNTQARDKTKAVRPDLLKPSIKNDN